VTARVNAQQREITALERRVTRNQDFMICGFALGHDLDRTLYDGLRAVAGLPPDPIARVDDGGACARVGITRPRITLPSGVAPAHAVFNSVVTLVAAAQLANRAY
jgi:hypothetical protein